MWRGQKRDVFRSKKWACEGRRLYPNLGLEKAVETYLGRLILWNQGTREIEAELYLYRLEVDFHGADHQSEFHAFRIWPYDDEESRPKNVFHGMD